MRVKIIIRIFLVTICIKCIKVGIISAYHSAPKPLSAQDIVAKKENKKS